MSRLDPTPATDEFRLPAEPYPGLRPFLDHESMLLFGRMRQIKEIIEHLRINHFVAVIGGSGSGKSSLINAGVVPELRSFGIRGAGDFWIPMVTTPGTAAGEIKCDEVTPITRFARKFSRLLTSRGSEADDDARVADIVACLRQPAGFSLLANTYVNELAVPPGPKPSDARLLFVIDQFEELFHPSNKDREDASLLVERVLDHFFRPHERCFVVLTMRSEHLSDCARYLELPDAINKASYLVRRLDEDELREAITAPAQRFLRLLQRKSSVGTSEPAVTLPAQVVFHGEVLARLLRDVQAITHDPDHLPLLQHLLARMWQTACRREGVECGGIPASILLADLAHAVAANASGDVALRDDVNVLRASVDNWAEAIFARRSPRGQGQVEALFRHLAFKEPNTGMYSQQRVNVDDPALFGEESGPSNRRELLELIEDPDRTRGGQFGFIGSVDYLFWDDEDPQQVTLKVSHESFIRGWMRFRSLVDKEADRFDVFVELVRRCGRWSGAGRPDRLLLESADLERITDERLQLVFAERQERASWLKRLMLDRDGPRLAPYDSDVDEFVALSGERQRAAVRAREEAAEATRVAIEGRRIAQAKAAADKILADAELRQAQRVNTRNLWLGLMALCLAIALVPNVLFSLNVQAKVMKSVDLFASARAIAERSGGQPTPAENERRLAGMLNASKYVIEGKELGTFSPNHKLEQALLSFGRMIPMGDAKSLVAKSTSEPVVNGQLRSLLTSTAWRSDNDPAKLADGAVRLPLRYEIQCEVASVGKTVERPPGILMLDSETNRGIFVPDRKNNPEFTLYAASYSNNVCSASSIIWSVPRYLNPAMIFDASLRYMALAADGQSGRDPSVSNYSISWDPVAKGQPPAARLQLGSVVTDSGIVKLVRSAAQIPADAGAKKDSINGVKTWSELGGIGVAVAGNSWRIFFSGAETVPSKHPNDWAKLNKPETGSQCERLGSVLQGRYRSARTEIYQANTHCFEIIQVYDEVLVAVYDEPLPNAVLEKEHPPQSIASIQLGRFAPGAGSWAIGKPGRYEGWIALQGLGPDGKEKYDGAPWSTAALMKLGNEVVSKPGAAVVAAALHTAAAVTANATPAPSRP